MPKVSRAYIEPQAMNHYIRELWKALAGIKGKKEIGDLLRDLLTPTEEKMFAKRLQIAKMLLTKTPYNEIKTKLKVQNSTIASVRTRLDRSPTSALEKAAYRLLRKLS